ncbi:hypothetical protein GM418_00465 [Maribellus comscasis]|uniref:Uncharacterized protein n=1 Tax=Maribellus comscasis TaxID=2681766 RepID=A0A6I6JLU3_9BACT|nr:hypothetical protein [Maribellus comscasis]QGY42179.1 hypothetical protein GM418_00465 [Maribellus comscasis]
MTVKAILLIRKSADTQELEEQKLQLTQYATSNFQFQQKNLVIIEHAESAGKNGQTDHPRPE